MDLISSLRTTTPAAGATTHGRRRGRRRCIRALLRLLPVICCGPFGALADETGQYEQLVMLFQEFRAMIGERGEEIGASPLVSPDAIAAEHRALKQFQERLRAIDASPWPIPQQVDYHLVRAELNGLEFRHRVTRPWFRDPGLYSDLVLLLGETLSVPIAAEDLPGLQRMLEFIPPAFTQARRNLQDVEQVPGDLATLATRDLRNSAATFAKLTNVLAESHPALAEASRKADQASRDFLAWLEAQQTKMRAPAGIGKENYNWLLKNVYLFPYAWDELRTLVELEDNRVIALQRLEENRNRRLPKIQPVQSQAQYQQSVASAIDDLLAFVRRERIFSMPAYLTPEGYFGSWHGFENPWPEKHDYFFHFSHREPRMEEAHEMLGHHFDQLRADHSAHPIRKGWRPYKISTARAEGFAFALEELLMHAGYLEQRSPRAREIVYQQAAFRTVRALSDIYLHANQWSLEQAMAYCVANAPRGDLLDDSPHLWFEMATTLRGVGHHMLMVAGKIQFLRLMRDSAQLQGDGFELMAFMDEFLASGLLPMALIRWEMTGKTDQVAKLW